MTQRLFVWKCLSCWRRRPAAAQKAVEHLRVKSFCEVARLVLTIRSLNMTVKRQSRIDTASFARQALREAHGKGPHELHKLLRGTLKMGRRYRAPQVLPALQIDDKVLTDADAINQAFELHFALPENGRACQVHELLAANAMQARSWSVPLAS